MRDWLAPRAAVLLGVIFALCSQANAQRAEVFDRHYRVGEILQYEMEGNNHGWVYRIHANDRVKKDDTGVFYEEIAWSNLRSNTRMALSASSLEFRQTLSLAPNSKYLAIPDLGKVQPFLIGPITDMLTFYSDVFLAKQTHLTHAGQRKYFEHGTPNSWADGQRVLLGQDSIDFDLVVLDEDARKHTATICIRHVPPKHPQVQLPAKWMEAPVGNTANNWVQVEKFDGKYKAQVGKEEFDVQIQLDMRDGKLLSAQLHNPVALVSRLCTDPGLSKCGGQESQTIVRDVSLDLVTSADKPDPVADRLANTELFAFGGIGFTNVIWQGEKDYRMVFSRSSAEADFEKIFSVGNRQAKCYALVALRKLNPERFKVLALSLRSSKGEVSTMHGCLASHEALAALSERIRAGDYSH